MSHKTTYLRLCWVFLLVCGSLLTLNLLGNHDEIEAASLRNNGGDPSLKSIVLSATENLILSDTLPGAANNRHVYFNNAQAGVLTLTFEISGTAPLTLTSGAAFGYTPTLRTIDTGALAWQPVITYPVPMTATTENGIRYLVTNASQLSTTLWLTYVQDISPPTVTLNVPAVLTTAHQPAFVLAGTVDDTGAGVARVEVMTESGGDSNPAEGTQSWIYTWTLPSADSIIYTPTVRAIDHVSNPKDITQPVTVDTVAPTATMPVDSGTWVPTSTLVFTWIAAQDNAGIRGYWINITGTQGLTLTSFTDKETYTITASSGVTEGETYYARLQAEDENGNRTTDFGARSDGITPDLTAPTVALILADRTSGHTDFTNARIVSATVDEDADTTAWLLSETQTAQPARDNPAWHTTEPITFELSTHEDEKTVYAWVKDRADNISPAPVSDTITLDIQPPASPSLALTDRTTDDPDLTDERVVSATIGNEDSDVNAWLLSEALSRTQPHEDHQAWIPTEPITFRLSSGDGEKAVYAWIKDRAGNINSDPVSDTITLDAQSPAGPTLALADRTTGNPNLTDERTVSATISNEDPDVNAWLLSETLTNTQPPPEHSMWTTTEPTTFTLSTGDGGKTVYVWVKDHAGNINVDPVSDTITLDTQSPPHPTLILADRTTSNEHATNEITVSITISDDAQAKYWLLSEDQVTQPDEDDEAWVTTEPTSFTLSASDGAKTVYVWIKDNIGNINTGPVSETILLDRRSPTVTVTVPNQAATTPVTVQWMAEDPEPSSGDLRYKVQYREDSGDWETWFRSTPITTAGFITAELDYTYTFSVTAQDAAGNADQGRASMRFEKFIVSLPLMLRSYHPLTNGDFEADLEGWAHGEGNGLLSGGSGLPYEIVNIAGSKALLLGDPELDDDDGNIPVGYSFVAQEFTVPDTQGISLTLKYRVHSYDVAYGLERERYYDTFEFSIGKPPSETAHVDLEGVPGCRGELDSNISVLYPTGEGVVFCDGQKDVAPNDDIPPSEWDSGWRDISIDLSAFRGKNMTLYISTWNREYDSPYYEDQGYYNTYAYVDDIALAE